MQMSPRFCTSLHLRNEWPGVFVSWSLTTAISIGWELDGPGHKNKNNRNTWFFHSFLSVWNSLYPRIRNKKLFQPYQFFKINSKHTFSQNILSHCFEARKSVLIGVSRSGLIIIIRDTGWAWPSNVKTEAVASFAFLDVKRNRLTLYFTESPIGNNVEFQQKLQSNSRNRGLTSFLFMISSIKQYRLINYD